MTKIHEYFQAERIESLVFMIIGATSIVCGFYFLLVVNSKFYNGLSWPLIFIGIMQLFVGTIIYFRSPTDIKRVTTFSQNSPKNIRNLEIPRMEKVMTKFKLYRYIEMGLTIIGLILFLIASPTGFWKGVGLGIIIQAGLMLIADSFAENRGHHYLKFLEETFN